MCYNSAVAKEMHMFKLFSVVIIAVIVGVTATNHITGWQQQVNNERKMQLRIKMHCWTKHEYYINGVNGLDPQKGIPCKTILGEEEYNRVKNN